MALTFTRDESLSPSAKSYRTTMPGNTVVWIGSIQFDSSYPTGGELIDMTDVDTDADGKSGTVVGMSVSPSTNATNELFLDVANQKLLAYVSATAAQVANTTDLSGVTGLFAPVTLTIEFTET